MFNDRDQCIMTRNLAAVILIACLPTFVIAMSTGAPASACLSVSPAIGHGGSTQPLASSPYILNVSQVTSAGGYTPGQTYTREYEFLSIYWILPRMRNQSYTISDHVSLYQQTIHVSCHVMYTTFYRYTVHQQRKLPC